jgi:replication initiation protein RepC
MIGISPSAWQDAVAVMGPEVAGITVCCLVERIDEIRSPGGYLRALTQEALTHRFSVARLVMALIHRPEPKS